MIGNEHRVLLVEDNFDLRTILSDLLVRNQYLLTAAADAEQALQRVDERLSYTSSNGERVLALDLVVLDIRLRDMSGLELLRLLREKFPVIPRVIAMSALEGESCVNEALCLGALDYLRKPVEPATFLQKIRSVLRQTDESPFHWSPFPGRQSIEVGGCPAIGTSANEGGVIVEMSSETGVDIEDVLEMECPWFRQLHVKRVYGRVVRISPLVHPRVLVELEFVGLSNGDVCKFRSLGFSRSAGFASY